MLDSPGNFLLIRPKLYSELWLMVRPSAKLYVGGRCGEVTAMPLMRDASSFGAHGASSDAPHDSRAF